MQIFKSNFFLFLFLYHYDIFGFDLSNIQLFLPAVKGIGRCVRRRVNSPCHFPILRLFWSEEKFFNIRSAMTRSRVI